MRDSCPAVPYIGDLTINTLAFIASMRINTIGIRNVSNFGSVSSRPCGISTTGRFSRSEILAFFNHEWSFFLNTPQYG